MTEGDSFRNFNEEDYVDENGEFIADGSAAGNGLPEAFASSAAEIESFLSLVLESGLVDVEDLNLACKDFFAENSMTGIAPSLDGLCEFLISTRRLTPWQCEKLKEGQSQGFFLDNYELLNDLGADQSFANYLAQEKGTKHRVKLRITPILPFPFPVEKPKFDVEEL
jgi:hypothetical protein